ncbi:hypothetical protein L2E82_16158 [Cichorium intybus]|uniref:Uncharacterized protein n=1 Tax=Cichorium intybus TaxID=13427 RepID=A0ACB9F5C5_CICIN|nr:hypothetical protein L2E82_16158 [Cichorium intybus]
MDGLNTGLLWIHLLWDWLQEEDNAKEKPSVPIVHLNVIRLLAELNVQVKKTEVVDTILPLFIESLEEGEASTPDLLRLRMSVWLLSPKVEGI